MGLGMRALVPDSPLPPFAGSHWCIATIDVPGSPNAQGTASAFSKLADLMNATIFGMQDVLLPKYDCPSGVTCVGADAVLHSMNAAHCTVAVAHEWRSPIHAMDIKDAHPGLVRLVNVHGGLKFSLSWRDPSTIKWWLRFYVEDALEMAALNLADHVVYPSHWMANWTCHNQGFCNAQRASVLPNVMTDADESERSSLLAQDPLLTSLSKPVKSFAYVGAVNDRKGIDTAVDAVCQHDVDLHIFGSIQRLDELAEDGSKYLNEAQSSCKARINVYGPVLSSEVWDKVGRLNACLLNPSQLENQPTVVYEAAKYKVPMLALRIGSVEEMVGNIDQVTVQRKDEFRKAVVDILAQGSHVTPSLKASVLTGATGWKALKPAPRAREMVAVHETYRIPDGAANKDLLPELQPLLHSGVRLVLVLPTGEFVPRLTDGAPVVDILSGRAFAPSVALGVSAGFEEEDTSLRVQPPFFFAEEEDVANYIGFPRGAPFIARPADLVAFAAKYPEKPFRAWAFGFHLYQQQQTVVSISATATAYKPSCAYESEDHGRMIRMPSNCRIMEAPMTAPGDILPTYSPTCINKAMWQSTCIAGTPLMLNKH